MMNQPFFSICIPTYNRACLLPAALDSALAQTDPDFEIVVVDNASTDNTQEVLKRYDDPRIRIVRNAETVSMYANHNICVEHARAPWVVFLHSDDRLMPSAIEQIRLDLTSHPNVDALCSPSGRWRSVIKDRPALLSGPEGVITLLRWHGPTPSGCAYRKTQLADIKFKADEISADYLLLFHLVNSGSVVMIRPQTVVEVGIGEHQYSNEWMLTGKYTIDVASVVGTIFSTLHNYKFLAEKMKEWAADEIADLLMFAAHANRLKEITMIEEFLKPRTDYKSSPHYKHVLIGRLFGSTALQKALLFIRKANNLRRR